MMHEISTQRAARTAGRRILGNVVGGCKETGVRTRRTDFERLASEGMTASAAV